MSDDDSQAILSRRRFLIQSALVSAGATLGVAACEDKKASPGAAKAPEASRTKPADTATQAGPVAPDAATQAGSVAPDVAQVEAPPCLSPPLRERIPLTITSDPPGATIITPAGDTLGVTPFEGEIEVPEVAGPWELRLEGYERHKVDLDPRKHSPYHARMISLDRRPSACLKVMPRDVEEPEAPPQICLTMAMPPDGKP